MDDNFTTLIEEITERLKSFNYEVTDEDNFILKFIHGKVENTIKNETNLDAVPSGLHHILVDMICGNLLYEKMNANKLTDKQIKAVVASISEGDTSVSYDTKTSPQAMFDTFVNKLMNDGTNEFATYRKMVW